MKTATVMGGKGFIGRHLAARLRAEGWDVWVPAKNDPELMRRGLGHVFYCAGLTADYASRPFDTVEAHVGQLNSVLHGARWDHLLYLSSTRLYDGLGVAQADETLPLTLDPNAPRHIFDLSKALGEAMCLAHGKAAVARLACVYKDDTDEDGFLPALMRQAMATPAGTAMAVDSSPTYQRDYVQMDDVLWALMRISEAGSSAIYNVASGENVTNAALFAVIEKQCGVTVVPARSAPANLAPVVGIERMRREFGWAPQRVLGQLAATLAPRAKEPAR